MILLYRNNSNICIPEDKCHFAQYKSPCVYSSLLNQIRAHAAVNSLFQSPSVSLSKHMAQA